MSALPFAHGPLASPSAAAPPCLIVNSRSFLASRGALLRRAVALAKRYGAEIIELREPAQLERELDRLRDRGQARLCVLSGDGTFQGVVQYLALLPGGSWRPELLALGGGRSNVTAREFDSSDAIRTLETALRRSRDAEALTVHERQVLRVEQERAVPRHGFLVAGSMIDAGIRLCEQHRQSGRSWLHRGPLSTQYCLAKAGVQSLLGRNPLPPYPELQIDTDTGARLTGPNRLLVVTTLLHRDGLYNPYALRGSGAVRMTAVSAAAPRFWSRLPRLLTGHFTDDMDLQQGYLSGRFDRIEVTGLATYSLDGEMFDADPTRPIVVQGGPRVRMLQP